MTLDRYRERRHFEHTPEPPDGPSQEPGQRRFCIQRHDARRLHYDLRLEHQGVLKSWAVPKGPSQDPKEKRLAVHTEDHPLEYLQFEGTIPAGNYGAGTMEVWDSGTYEVLDSGDFDQQYIKGDLKLAFHGQRIQGAYALVRTGEPNWLWIKKNQMPGWVEPMLAVSSAPFSDPDYAFELKWDGFRALAFAHSGKLRLLSRRGNSLLRQFPELHSIPSAIEGGEFILDGEVVCLDQHGVAQFQRLQSRAQATHTQRLMDSDPATYYVFDLLYLDGQDLRPWPWHQRRARLQEVLRPSPWVRLSDSVDGQGEAFFALIEQKGLEGMMAKRRQAAYRSGRSNDWLKVKTYQEMDCFVCGLTEPDGGRQHFGSLVLGIYEEGQLRHVGNVGSGFTQQTLEQVAEMLLPLFTDQCPFVEPPPAWRWVRPELQCKVRYNSRTQSGSLRGPVFIDMIEPEQKLVPGRRLKLTNLDKVLFPQDGFTKGDLLRYYEEVAPLILPHLKDRPLSLKRYPDGIDKEFFFQKRAYPDFPAWLPTYPLENSRGQTVETPLCNDLDSLLFLVNLGCIDHNPWLSRISSLDQPDFMMLDLDPAECAFERLIEGAQAVQQVLDQLGLQSFPKTSGSRGLHIYVPVAPGYEFELTRTLAHAIARLLAQRHPNLFTLLRTPAKRAQDRVYLDAPQNRRGATTAGPYVIRAIAGAPVSTPLHWHEVKPGLDFRAFNLHTAPGRFEQTGDLLAPMLSLPQRLEEPVARLGELL